MRERFREKMRLDQPRTGVSTTLRVDHYEAVEKEAYAARKSVRQWVREVILNHIGETEEEEGDE